MTHSSKRVAAASSLTQRLGLVCLAWLLSCAPEAPSAPSVVLITLDTTIPEALSCYGFVDGTTPNLDRFVAQRGVRFDEARTVAPMTMPAHASMLTGLTPPRHSVRVNGSMVLPEEAHTVAERLGEAGYATAAFLAAVVLDGEMGLDQGFDVYDSPRTPDAVSEHLAARRTAREVVDRALAWYAARDEERPFFLWVHCFDPHFPYEPPPEFLAAAGGNAYYGAVASMDHELGRLLETLQADDTLARSLTLVVGDHGEALGRHGEATHMAFAYDATLRVPFLARFPEGFSGAPAAGSASSAIVSVVDVQPTILDVLGLGPSADVDGTSLAGAGPAPDRGAYFETYYGHHAFGWGHLCGWVDAQGKYVHGAAPEFFRTGSDREEATNRIGEVDTTGYREALSALAGRDRLTQEGLGDAFGGLRGQIEKLGYVGSGAPPQEMPDLLAPPSGPDPHQRIGAFADFLKAQTLSAERRANEAIQLLRPLLAQNPRHHQAAFLLGLNLMERGLYAEAVAPLRQSIAHRGQVRNGADLNLALCYERIGRLDEAVAEYESYFRDTDGPPGALETFIGLLERLGDDALLEQYRERLRQR